MINSKPMLSATALLSGVVLAIVSAAGFGSWGLVLTVGVALANLVGLSILTWFYTRAVQRGEPAALGLAALHGKTVIVLASVALLGGAFGAAPVALGFVLVMSCFTIAAPAVALFPSLQTVEAL